MVISPITIADWLSRMVPGSSSSETPRSTAYEPTPVDIYVVNTMLSRTTRLPPDIVDVIFDHAGYWAHSTNSIDFTDEHKSPLRITGGGKLENRFLLRSVPIGLTAIDDRTNLAEELAYDTNESKPRPLKTQFDPSFFKKLAGYPTPKLVNPVRKIVFTIKSKDQGWGGDRNRNDVDEYKASWTWFEAGLERFDREQICEPHCPSDLRYNSPKAQAPSLPLCALRPVQPAIKPSGKNDGGYVYDHPLASHDRYTIQRNKTANRKWQYNVVTWSWDDNVDPESNKAKELVRDLGRGMATATGEFVRGLKIGDVVSVWGKARFPGWVNNVEKVRIDVYWAI